MPDGSGRARPGRGFSLLGLLLPLGAALSLGLPPPQPGLIFVDSSTYLSAAAGRPPVPFLFFSLFGTGYAAVVAQSALSIASWTWCGWTLLGAVGACLGALLALAAPVAAWNCAILSESLAISLAALSVGATVAASDRWSWPRFALWTTAATLFSATRVATVLLVPFLAAPVLWSSSQVRRRLITLAVAAAVLALGVAWFVAGEGEQARARQRMTQIALLRVLPDPEARAFFVEKGMPIEPGLERYRQRWWLTAFHPEEFARATPMFQAWLETAAPRTYVRWLLTWRANAAVATSLAEREPAALSPFLARPEMMRLRPVSDRLTAPFAAAALPFPLWLAGSLLPLGCIVLTRRVGSLELLALSLPAGIYALGFAGYHGDAIELERHMALARILYRLLPLVQIASVWRCVRHHSGPVGT